MAASLASSAQKYLAPARGKIATDHRGYGWLVELDHLRVQRVQWSSPIDGVCRLTFAGIRMDLPVHKPQFLDTPLQLFNAVCRAYLQLLEAGRHLGL